MFGIGIRGLVFAQAILMLASGIAALGDSNTTHTKGKRIVYVKRSELKASDYAQAVQVPTTIERNPTHADKPIAAGFISKSAPSPTALQWFAKNWHRAVLPVSIGIFLLSIGLWALIEVENKAIKTVPVAIRIDSGAANRAHTN